jgi:hypothetical protein
VGRSVPEADFYRHLYIKRTFSLLYQIVFLLVFSFLRWPLPRGIENEMISIFGWSRSPVNNEVHSCLWVYLWSRLFTVVFCLVVTSILQYNSLDRQTHSYVSYIYKFNEMNTDNLQASGSTIIRDNKAIFTPQPVVVYS